MDESFITKDPNERLAKYGYRLEEFKKGRITKEQMTKGAIQFEKWIRNIWM